MTESKQDPAMRRQYMGDALRRLREAKVAMADARDDLFGLDYMPHRAELGDVKDRLEGLISQLSRTYDREFPDG